MLSDPAAPDAVIAEQLNSPETAAAMLDMYLTTADWIHRRTEHVAFIDASTTRRRTAVDLTVPYSAASIQPAGSDPIYRLILVDVVDKVPLAAFDIKNERGEPIPVLSRAQNGTLAARLLVDFAAKTAARFHTKLSDDEVEDLELVATASKASAEAALARLRRGHLGCTLSDTGSPLGSLAATLAQNFLMVCVLPAKVGERRIIKIAYEQEPDGVDSDTRTFWRRVGQRLGVVHSKKKVPCGSLPDADSYHLEIDAPSQLEIVSAQLVHFDEPDGWPEVAGPAVRIVASSSGVHLNVSRVADPTLDPGLLERPRIALSMRPERTAWLATATLTAIGVLALFVFTGPALEKSAPRGNIDPAALLAAVVALLLVLVNQPAQHPMSAKMLAPARYGSLLAALLPLIAAWRLAFFGRPGAQDWWPWLTTLSVACAVVTVLPYVTHVGAWTKAIGLRRHGPGS